MESILAALALLVVGYTVGSPKIINQGNEALVERLGRYHRKLTPGLNFLVPFLDSIVLEETVREQVLDLPLQHPLTKDNVFITVDSTIYWRILQLERTYYSVTDPDEAIKNLATTLIYSEVSKLTLSEVSSGVSEITQSILDQMDHLSSTWGIKITHVNLKIIETSKNDSEPDHNPKDNSVSKDESGILEIGLTSDINWVVYGQVVEQMSKKGIEILTQDWENRVEGDKHGKSTVRIEYLPATADKKRVCNDFLLAYGKLKFEFDNAKLERKIEPGGAGTEDKRFEKIEDMFRQVQALIMTSQKQNSVVVNNLVARSAFMEDQSRKIEIGSIGRDFTASGQALNLGEMDISGQVINTINQLPDSPSDQLGIKELLIQLQKAVEEEAELSIEDKADLLEQVKSLAEAKQAPEAEKREGLARKARKMFEATLKGLPDTAKIVESCSKLLPLILKALGVPV